MYAAHVAALGGLTFPLSGDGVHFWQTTIDWFSRSAVPSIAALRSYDELNTPLPFVVWGALEHGFHQGIWVPRALNLVLSFLVAALIAWPPGAVSTKRIAAAAGLLLCPYYLFVSARIYTDVPAIFCAAFGLWAYLDRRPALSAAFFVLGIACRQYIVAFPLAIVAHELTKPAVERSRRAIIASTAAAASLAGWVLLFHGVAPPAAIDEQGIVTANPVTVIPQNALYFLACLGLYFTVPARVFAGRLPDASDLPGRRMLAAGAAIAVLFVLFPPFGNQSVPTAEMGLFDRALHAAGLPPILRATVFGVFAIAAVWSLSGQRLALWLAASNALVLLKGPGTWDKYALPALAGLWLLTSRGETYDRAHAHDVRPL